MGYERLTWGYFKKFPFEIVPGGDAGPNSYYVSEGFLFHTFSLNVHDNVPILGIGIDGAFDLKPNHKIYIEVGIDENLEPSYAEIKCTEVNTDENWKYYPFPGLIEPEFGETNREKNNEFPWDAGRVLKLIKSRRQTKLYILIGYRDDDSNKNGNSVNNRKGGSSPVQILKENIILMGGVMDYAPSLIAVPYFYGGLTHIEKLSFDTLKEE